MTWILKPVTITSLIVVYVINICHADVWSLELVECLLFILFYLYDACAIWCSVSRLKYVSLLKLCCLMSYLNLFKFFQSVKDRQYEVPKAGSLNIRMTVASLTDVPLIEPFDCAKRTGIAAWWKQWLRTFKLYSNKKGITGINQKCALLLHTAALGHTQYFLYMDRTHRGKCVWEGNKNFGKLLRTRKNQPVW